MEAGIKYFLIVVILKVITSFSSAQAPKSQDLLCIELLFFGVMAGYNHINAGLQDF
jgi:hypothetical protein